MRIMKQQEETAMAKPSLAQSGDQGGIVPFVGDDDLGAL